MTEFSPLPSGWHGLTREQVRASQRERLMRGMAEVVAEQGYPDTSVAQVLSRVHISRQTFYEHFSDKQDCFLAALDAAGRALAAALAETLDQHGEPAAALAAMMTTYLTRLRDEPAYARVFFVESAAAGVAAQRARIRVQQRFVDLMITKFRDTSYWQRAPDPEFACRMLIGGMSSLVTTSFVVDGTSPPLETVTRLVALTERVFADPGH